MIVGGQIMSNLLLFPAMEGNQISKSKQSTVERIFSFFKLLERMSNDIWKEVQKMHFSVLRFIFDSQQQNAIIWVVQTCRDNTPKSCIKCHEILSGTENSEFQFYVPPEKQIQLQITLWSLQSFPIFFSHPLNLSSPQIVYQTSLM